MLTNDEIIKNKERIQEYFNQKTFINNRGEVSNVQIKLPFYELELIDYINETIKVNKPDIYNEIIQWLKQPLIKTSSEVTPQVSKPAFKLFEVDEFNEIKEVDIYKKPEESKLKINIPEAQIINTKPEIKEQASNLSNVINNAMDEVLDSVNPDQFKPLEEKIDLDFSMDAFNDLNIGIKSGLIPIKSPPLLTVLNNTHIKFRYLNCHGVSFKPVKAHGNKDTGYDCFAFIVDEKGEPYFKTIRPRSRELIKLGFSHSLDNEVYEFYSNGKIIRQTLAAQLRPRSGLASKGIKTEFGTLDPIWDNQSMAIMVNDTDQAVTIKFGDKICQLCIEWVPILDEEWEEFSGTDDSVLNLNGRGGFGSTGT